MTPAAAMASPVDALRPRSDAEIIAEFRTLNAIARKVLRNPYLSREERNRRWEAIARREAQIAVLQHQKEMML